MTVAFLFPGQGSQSAGLLHQLPRHSEVTRTIHEAGDVLGLDPDSLDNAANILTQISVAGVIAVGLTFVILCAEIDLSVAAIANARTTKVRRVMLEISSSNLCRGSI